MSDPVQSGRKDRSRKTLISTLYSAPGRFYLYLAISLCAFVALFLFVRPTEDLDIDVSKEVYSSWDDNISNLAIEPVYPPSEDFYVGDIMLSVTGPANADLAGKTVRIGHLDMSDTYLNISSKQIVDESLPKTGEAQAETVVSTPYGNVPTTYVGFPGLVAIRKQERSGSWFWQKFAAFMSSEDEQTDEISIPLAESYEASVPSALGRLLVWCHEPKTAFLCKGDYLRKLIGFYDPIDVGQVPKGEQIQLSIEIITEVYLARKITHKKVISRKGNISVQQPSSSEKSDKQNNLNDQSPNTGENREHSVTDQLDEVFPRPVVFGYRGISIQAFAAQ